MFGLLINVCILTDFYAQHITLTVLYVWCFNVVVCTSLQITVAQLQFEISLPVHLVCGQIVVYQRYFWQRV